MNPFSSRKKQVIALLIIIITGLSGKLFAQSDYPADVKERISKVENNLGGGIRIEGESPFNLQQRMKFYNVPGVSVAVIRNFKVDWVKAYGLADNESKIPVTTKTLFQAASISKSLNGVGAMKLVEEKKMDLDADINNYLTSWKFPYDSVSGNKKITLRNLLSHTAGLTVHGFPGYEPTDKFPSVNQILDGVSPANTKAVRSQFAPSSKVQYSGGGTTITQVMIADQTKISYAKYMNEKILAPLGMTGSFYGYPAPAAKAALLSTGYSADGTPVKGKYHVYPEQAAAGLWTNPTDLAKYIIETQLAIQGKSGKVLSKVSTLQRLNPVIGDAALGVFIVKKGNATYFTHGGSNEGFRCQYFGDLENGNGIVVMVNSDNGAILNEIINSVATVYNWKEFYNPVVKKIQPVESELLTSYTGRYQLSPDMIITISAKENQLFAQATNQQAFAIYPETVTMFFVKEFEAKMEFSNDKLVLHQNGQKMDAKKLP